MSKELLIQGLITERALLLTQKAKMAKFNPNKNDRMYIRGGPQLLRAYCRFRFYDVPLPLNINRKLSLCESYCGKKITLFINGSIVYDGTIKYLERWANNTHKLSHVNSRLAGLGVATLYD